MTRLLQYFLRLLALPMTMMVGLAAQLPPDWQYYQTLQIDRPGFIKISVPLETLDAARPQAEDLRLCDAAGREITFRIEQAAPQPAIQSAKNFKVFLENQATIAEFETGTTQSIIGVLLETPAGEFIKAATVDGSLDGRPWQRLARGLPLYRQRDGTSLLELPVPPGPWTRLRVTLDDQKTQPIPVSGARVRLVEAEPPPVEPLAIKITDRLESTGRTRLLLQAAGAHAWLDRLEIHAQDALFSRPVTLAYRDFQEGNIREHELARSRIFRAAIEGQPPVSHISLAQRVRIPARELVLEIANGDSPPLNITAVLAFRRPVQIAFQTAQAGEYHLLSGNARCAAPQYDLAQFPAQLNAPLITPQSCSPLKPNPDYRKPETLPEYGESSTPIGLAPWRFRKPILLGEPAVYQVELDLETLSRAAAGLGDLRVIKEARQVPFLLDRQGPSRVLVPGVENADDPKRPTVSRWRLKLPYPALPITQINCETDAPFFQRQVKLLETVTDVRGERSSLVLAQATWQRLPGQARDKLTLTLASTTTDTLLMEIENGDNPALSLKNFECRYAAPRLLIKTAGTAPTFLYFGNREAIAPQYDLALAARQLFDAEKKPAGLGPMETLKKSSWLVGAGDADGKTQWIFWLVLGVVVIGLFFIISRLLPKQPENNESERSSP